MVIAAAAGRAIDKIQHPGLIVKGGRGLSAHLRAGNFLNLAKETTELTPH